MEQADAGAGPFREAAAGEYGPHGEDRAHGEDGEDGECVIVFCVLTRSSDVIVEMIANTLKDRLPEEVSVQVRSSNRSSATIVHVIIPMPARREELPLLAARVSPLRDAWLLRAETQIDFILHDAGVRSNDFDLDSFMMLKFCTGCESRDGAADGDDGDDDGDDGAADAAMERRQDGADGDDGEDDGDDGEDDGDDGADAAMEHDGDDGDGDNGSCSEAAAEETEQTETMTRMMDTAQETERTEMMVRMTDVTETMATMLNELD